ERRKINCDLPLCPSVAPASEPEPGGVGFCFTIDVGTNLKPLDSNFSSYRDYENLTLFLWLKNASFLSLY
ncbi:hypothetical protein, partial [Cloacibacillus evryensis]|uniref:hypothetical protein n=1 Tax=Cloacibacillus evryensis TaxID=508460 RepID=UPI001C9BDC8D